MFWVTYKIWINGKNMNKSRCNSLLNQARPVSPRCWLPGVPPSAPLGPSVSTTRTVARFVFSLRLDLIVFGWSCARNVSLIVCLRVWLDFADRELKFVKNRNFAFETSSENAWQWFDSGKWADKSGQYFYEFFQIDRIFETWFLDEWVPT